MIKTGGENVASREVEDIGFHLSQQRRRTGGCCPAPRSERAHGYSHRSHAQPCLYSQSLYLLRLNSAGIRAQILFVKRDLAFRVSHSEVHWLPSETANE